jgi:CubicO group peptidase (beta-lactamase class C family)
MSGFQPVAALLDAGARDGTFPAAQAVAIAHGREVFFGHAGSAHETTRFDLASLTKVMATTATFMRLWAMGLLAPEAPVRSWLPGSAIGKAGASVADLLYHRSGLPAFIPFFSSVLRNTPELLRADCPPATRVAARDAVVGRALHVEATKPIGSAAKYSDVGFIILAELLACAGGAPLDALYEEHVARPLGLEARFQPISRHAPRDEQDVAPTGTTRPREPAPEQHGMWPPLAPAPSRPGEVDDDNAFVMDGVAGHSGLFGTARDVARFGQAVLDDLAGANRIAPASLWERALTIDPSTPDSTRALGFDTPTISAGRYLGRRPPGGFGHLGFTGVSLWVDRARSLVVALCTNRTYNGRANVRIRQFRPRFHDAVVEAIGTDAMGGGASGGEPSGGKAT